MMVATAVGITSCQDGEVGPKGEKGGAESTTFGNVELTISGVTSTGDSYSEVVDFKFLSGDDPYNSAWAWRDLDLREINLSREYIVEAKPDGRTNAASDLTLNLYEIEGRITLDYFQFGATLIVGDTFERVGTQVSFSDDDYDNFVMSNYSFNDRTGVIKFDFSYFWDAPEGRTNIAGKVNAKVYMSR